LCTTPRRGITAPSLRVGPASRARRAQVAGDMEVKGVIRLGCRTVTGKPFVVSRSFQLTQKKGGKYEFKALDQTIRTAGEGGEARGSREGDPPGRGS
jgi:DNA repair protein RAD50